MGISVAWWGLYHDAAPTRRPNPAWLSRSSTKATIYFCRSFQSLHPAHAPFSSQRHRVGGFRISQEYDSWTLQYISQSPKKHGIIMNYLLKNHRKSAFLQCIPHIIICVLPLILQRITLTMPFSTCGATCALRSFVTQLWKPWRTYTGWWLGTSLFFHSVGKYHPNWISYFSEGWVKHQPYP